MSAYLKVITGPMFSGKSEELIRLMRRHTYARKRIIAIKPKTDTRQNGIRSRQINEAGESITFAEFPALEVSDRAELSAIVTEHIPDVLAIDECHFFGPWITEYIHSLLVDPKNNLIIYIVGLDQESHCKTFGPMGDLMALADEVVKMKAICFNCGQEANVTIDKSGTVRGEGEIRPGDIEIYEARCRTCWRPPQND